MPQRLTIYRKSNRNTENPHRSVFLIRFFGPVRGPDFGPNLNLVRSVVRFLSELEPDTVFGPE